MASKKNPPRLASLPGGVGTGCFLRGCMLGVGATLGNAITSGTQEPVGGDGAHTDGAPDVDVSLGRKDKLKSCSLHDLRSPRIYSSKLDWAPLYN